MRRRDLLGLLTTAAASGAALRSHPAFGQAVTAVEGDVDPYFLDTGETDEFEEELLREFEREQEGLTQGRIQGGVPALRGGAVGVAAVRGRSGTRAVPVTGIGICLRAGVAVRLRHRVEEEDAISAELDHTLAPWAVD